MGLKCRLLLGGLVTKLAKEVQLMYVGYGCTGCLILVAWRRGITLVLEATLT